MIAALTKNASDGRIDGGVLDRLVLVAITPVPCARLHDRGVQVQVVRHHGGAKDAHRDVEHVWIPNHLSGWYEATGHAQPVRFRQHHL
jgi:hypothetical protein